MKLIQDLTPEETRELDDKITMQNLENILTSVKKHGINDKQLIKLSEILIACYEQPKRL